MNKSIKKLMSFILCAVLLFTTASVAFAAEDNSEEVLEKDYTCHNYHSNDYAMGFIVVTFNSKYSQTGEIPEVCIYFGSSGKHPVTEDLITLKVFENEGKRYPQLFIKLNYVSINRIEIGEGAFVTESGESSGKVKIPGNKITKANDLGVSCRLEAFEIEEHIDLITGKMCRYTAVGKPVRIVGYGEYGEAWLSGITVTYTVNGKTTETNSGEFVPQEPGSYVVELKLGDVAVKTLEFDVLSESKAYSKNLGNATVWLLLTPLYLVLGTGLFVFIPGFGTWIGSTTVMAAFAMIPRFFTALFSGPIYKEYIIK